METNTENLITITPRITLNPPVLQDIEVTENGEYKADGSADGLGTVTVNVKPNNEEITVTENGEYTPSEEFDGISKVTVDVQPQINLETLNVDENGTYTPQTGFDGFGEVNVNIPAPVLDDINITENGEYNPVNDGFSKVTVDVPDPVLDDINITENGNYVSEHDGFNNVTVAVPDKPLETKNITENGTYTPSQGKYGFSKVNVAVPDKPLETKNITENGSYSPSQGIYGFSQVTVDVQPDNEELNVVQNGIYTPSANKDGFSKVNVAVPDKPLEIKNIISNGQYTPSSGYYGFSQINVDIETYEPPLNLVLINPVADSNINLPLTFQWSIDNLEQGETPVYYLFVDDVLVYKGNNTSYTMQAMPIASRNHTCYVVANTSNRSSFTDSINFSLPYEFIYGFDIDQDNTDPTAAVTYTDDCIGFETAGLDNNNVFQYGDWKPFIDRLCRPVMLRTDGTVDYELDHINFNNKLDGTLSDITNINYDGNAMVEFKKVYTKVWQEVNTIKVRFCDVRLDSDYQAWAFVNDDGDEQDYLYVSMFPAIDDTNTTKLMSIGVAKAYYQKYISNITDSDILNTLPTGYGRLSYVMLQFIRLLHILITKSRDFETYFGKASATNDLNATHISNGGFYGNKNSSITDIRTFYIQYLFSLRSPIIIIDGVYTNPSNYFLVKNTRPYEKINPQNMIDSTGYVNSGVKVNYARTYIQNMIVKNGIIIPYTYDGNGNLNYKAYIYTDMRSNEYNVFGLSSSNFTPSSIHGMVVMPKTTTTYVSTFITYLRPTQSQNNS